MKVKLILKRIIIFLLFILLLIYISINTYANGLPVEFHIISNGNPFPVPTYNDVIEINNEKIIFKKFKI